MTRLLSRALLLGLATLAPIAPALAHPLYPDEPVGFNQLVRHQFNDKTNGGLCQDQYPGGDAIILSDATLTTSPPYFLRDQKQPNQGQGGTSINCPFTAQRAVFWGFRMRTSNPFGGYDNGANKIGFVLNNRPVANGQWGLHYRGAANGSRVIGVFLQDAQVNNCHIPNLDDGGFNQCATLGGVFLPNVNGSPIAEGVDHRIELTLIKSTTAISRDGVVRLVVDGILRTYNTNVNTPQFEFISVQNNHTWDGQCATHNPPDCRPYLDYYDFDDWYVSGGAGGGIVSPPPPPLPPPARPSNLQVSQ